MKLLLTNISWFSIHIIKAHFNHQTNKIYCQPNSPCSEALQQYKNDLSNNNYDDNNKDIILSNIKSTSILNLDVNGINGIVTGKEGGGNIAHKTNNLTKNKNRKKGRFGLKLNIPVINNYGCWCYGGQYWPGALDWTGYGPVMDEYDDACKAHHMGFDCITLDSKINGETCIPNETEYDWTIIPQSDGGYSIECSNDIIDDWCRHRTCMVDLRFIARHWQLENEGIQPNYKAYGHPGFHTLFDGDETKDTSITNVSNFNIEANCLVPKSSGTGNHKGNEIKKVCCGDYPHRIWYDKSNDKGLNCCEYEDPLVTREYGFTTKLGRLYNELSSICCSSGVKSAGTFCS